MECGLLEISGTGKSRRRRAEEFRRENERLRDMLAYKDELQRDWDRQRLYAGLPAQFIPIAMFGQGVTPLTLPGSATIRTWHVSTRGLQLTSSLLGSGSGTPPVCNYDAAINESIPLRMDCLVGGARGDGISKVGFTIDGGFSYFQQSFTATFVSVPNIGRTLTMGTGTFVAGQQWVSPIATCLNQAPVAATLSGPATDSSKPVLDPLILNGFPGIRRTNGPLTDTTSTWAADVASGTNKSFTWMVAYRLTTATPSAVGTIMAMNNNAQVGGQDPNFFLGVRNGTNLFRAARTNDAGTATTRDGGALSTVAKVITLGLTGNNVSLWVNGVIQVNALSLGSGTDTLNNVSFFAQFKNSAATASLAGWLFEAMTYTSFLSTGDRQANENYLLGKYGL